MSALLVAVGILFVVAGAVSGSLGHMMRARRLHRRDKEYGVRVEHLRYIAGGLGGATGIVIGAMAAYYLSLNQRVDFITWVGRLSYVLIALSVSGHLLTLIHLALHLYREEKAVAEGLFKGSSLSAYRSEMLNRVREKNPYYIDLKSKDE